MLKKVSAVLCGVMLCASLAAATPIIEDVGNPASTEVNPKFFANAMEGMTQATSIYTVWNEQYRPATHSLTLRFYRVVSML